jgi:hypothetical protein
MVDRPMSSRSGALKAKSSPCRRRPVACADQGPNAATTVRPMPLASSLRRLGEAGPFPDGALGVFNICALLLIDVGRIRGLCIRRRRLGFTAYSATQPPSTGMLEPVIWAAESEQRNTAVAATCSGVTNCLVGWE